MPLSSPSPCHSSNTNKKAETVYTRFIDYLKLAKAGFENTGDAEFASSVYQKAAATNPDCNQLVDLAKALADDLKDMDAAVPVLKQAENAVKSNADFIKTAKAIQEIIKNDKEWTDAITFQLEKREEFKDLYSEFIVRESESKTSYPMRMLAGDVVAETGDIYYGAKLYKQAEELTVNFNDFIKLAFGIHKDLKDSEWVKSIYSELLEKCSSLFGIVPFATIYLVVHVVCPKQRLRIGKSQFFGIWH